MLDEILQGLLVSVEELEVVCYEDFELNQEEIQKLEKCKNELIDKVKEFYRLNGEIFQ